MNISAVSVSNDFRENCWPSPHEGSKPISYDIFAFLPFGGRQIEPPDVCARLRAKPWDALAQQIQVFNAYRELALGA
jgi:hypothetical protein